MTMNSRNPNEKITILFIAFTKIKKEFHGTSLN